MGQLIPQMVRVKRPIEVTTFGDNEPQFIYVEDVEWTYSSEVRCDYCGLYGELGRCEGCGAPNSPAKESR